MGSANTSDPGGRVTGFSKRKYRAPWDIGILKNIYLKFTLSSGALLCLVTTLREGEFCFTVLQISF